MPIDDTRISLGHAESIFAAKGYQLDDMEMVVYLNADEINVLKSQDLIELLPEPNAEGLAVWRWTGPRSR